MSKKSQDLLMLEEIFARIKANPKGDNRNELDSIQRVLSRRYGIKAQINIVDNTGMDFFGMSVYPEEDVIDKMVDSLIDGTNKIDVIEDIWAKNENWVIEIDSILLHDYSINANPAEITAVLLHEIGHTVHSNEIPARVGKVIKYASMNVSINVKKILKWTKARKILGLAFIEGSNNKNYHRDLQRETKADELPQREGYGEDLSQFINKLITKRGNSLVDRNEKELENEISSIVDWGMINVSQLEHRKSVLDRNIKGQLLRTKSPYVRNYLLNIRALFFGKSEDRIRQMVAEQYTLKEYEKYTDVTEAFKNLFAKNGRIQKVTQQDIDYIIIEANRIVNENDRIYVMDLIYAKMDIVELSLDLLSNSDTAHRVTVSKETLKSQKEELLNLRRQVMALKVKPRDFSIFVNYPKGYEG